MTTTLKFRAGLTPYNLLHLIEDGASRAPSMCMFSHEHRTVLSGIVQRAVSADFDAPGSLKFKDDLTPHGAQWFISEALKADIGLSLFSDTTIFRLSWLLTRFLCDDEDL